MGRKKSTEDNPLCAVCDESLLSPHVIYLDNAFGAGYCSLNCARLKFFKDADDIIIQLWELHKYGHLEEVIKD